MSKRSSNFFIVFSFLVLIFVASGCGSSSAPGQANASPGDGTRYLNARDNNEYLDLMSNNTYVLNEGSGEEHGTYAINGTDITLAPNNSGDSRKGHIMQGVIYDPDGIAWINSSGTFEVPGTYKSEVGDATLSIIEIINFTADGTYTREAQTGGSIVATVTSSFSPQPIHGKYVTSGNRLIATDDSGQQTTYSITGDVICEQTQKGNDFCYKKQ